MKKDEHWEEALEDLLSAKGFAELSEAEQQWVLGYLTQEEYESMRQVETNIWAAKADNQLEPHTESWLHIAAAQKAQPRLFSWKISAAAACISWMVIGSAAFYVGAIGSKKSGIGPTKPISISKVDTVYINTPPDTVYIQQVVYRDRPQRAVVKEVGQPLRQANSQTGVSMKEKEDLNSLLVSGED